MDIVANRTSRDLWEDLAARSATQTFLVFEDRDGCCVEYTYGAFARRIDQTANLLRDLGVAKGDMVAVHLGNSPELLMCAFGAVALGATFAAIGGLAQVDWSSGGGGGYHGGGGYYDPNPPVVYDPYPDPYPVDPGPVYSDPGYGSGGGYTSPGDDYGGGSDNSSPYGNPDFQ